MPNCSCFDSSALSAGSVGDSAYANTINGWKEVREKARLHLYVSLLGHLRHDYSKQTLRERQAKDVTFLAVYIQLYMCRNTAFR